jgi:hypothetical protein
MTSPRRLAAIRGGELSSGGGLSHLAALLSRWMSSCTNASVAGCDILISLAWAAIKAPMAQAVDGVVAAKPEAVRYLQGVSPPLSIPAVRPSRRPAVQKSELRRSCDDDYKCDPYHISCAGMLLSVPSSFTFVN